METQRSRRGCTACRIRHLKCDETRPACLRCQSSRRECERGPLFSQWQEPKGRKRHNGSGDHESRKERRWVEIPSTLTFVTDCTVEDMLSQRPLPQQPNDEVSMDGSEDSSSVFRVESTTGVSQFDSNAPSSSNPLQCPNMNMDFLELPPLDPMSLISIATDTSSASEAGITCDLRQNDVNLGLLANRPYRTQDRTEAHLMRHYCQTLAPWFDVTDSNRHFQLEVPKRAWNCEVLLNAIFALSALHLSRVAALDPSIAEVYHSRCNTQLIPLLNDECCVANENVLATVVILRKYEELGVVITGQDHGHHLAGVSALFSSPDCPFTEGLAKAAFWQFVRQDIYMSLSKRQSPRTSISIQPPLSSDETITDCYWANHMVWGTVAIMTLCFGDEVANPITYEDYTQRVNKWHEDKPTSFTPIFYRERSVEDGRYFPEIWLSDPWHAIGWQYYHLARILLALHNPNLQRPAASLKSQRAHHRMERDVLEHARMSCGIASSNNFITTRFTLCAILLTCGGLFRGPQEQEAIIQLLSATGNESGWPTESVIQALKESWTIE